MMNDLVATARSFFVPGKGILAADESVHTATTRLAEYGIQAGEEMRRQYRDLFIGTEGIEKFLSGVILSPDTFIQKGKDKKLFHKSLFERGIMPGVKVDLGTEPLQESPHELITQGLIDLPERLSEYKKQGAIFTKWRAVIRIDDDQLPTPIAIHENARRLANYAKESQAAGLVPVLEPEILIQGKHSRLRSRTVIGETLKTLFSVLVEHSVDRAGLILKTSMALSGSDSGKKDMPREIAEDTVDVLMQNVPSQVAGIVFLSGGQTPEESTENLAAISIVAKEKHAPWPLSFSYARALQEEALAIWKGKPENIIDARAAFLDRLAKVSGALGHY